MAQHVVNGKKLYWRITKAVPQGEYFDADKPPDAPAPPVQEEPMERPEPGWRMSSFELAHGLEVSEEPDTVPGDLFDELFKPRR